MKQAALSFSLAVVLLLGLASLAWARDERMVASPDVPAAIGVLSFDHDRNGNTKLHIDVHHLAEPAQLTPARNTYVVWVQRHGEPPQNVGELRVNHDLDGSFRTSVPYQVFDVFVTPEQNPRASAPSGPDVLKATVNAR